MSENKLIEVTVKFFADLQQLAPELVQEELPEGSKIKELLEKYKIPSEKKLIIMVNGIPHKDRTTNLNDGDIVAVFPPLAGG